MDRAGIRKYRRMYDESEVRILTDKQMQMVMAEIDRQHIARLLKVAIGNTNTPDDYAAMITRERYEMQAYEDDGGILRKLGDILLVTWACVWLILLELGEYLTRAE